MYGKSIENYILGEFIRLRYNFLSKITLTDVNFVTSRDLEE